MVEIIRPIEPFQLTQEFGVNPEAYKKFGLKGHNGWDLRTKYPDTPQGHRNIFSSWLMKFYRSGVDPKGYGNFFETTCQLKSLWKLTYAHCLSIETFTTKQEGETMAISDNTGNSTGAHLHLTVKRIKIENGQHVTIDNNNGYFGAVNPQEFFDELRMYKTKGTTPKEGGDLMVQIEDNQFKDLVHGSTEWDKTVNEYKGGSDPKKTQFEEVAKVISGFKSETTASNNKVKELTDKAIVLEQEVTNQKEKVANVIDECQRTIKLKEAEINNLKQNSGGNDTLVGQLRSTIGVLEGKLRDEQIAHGKTKIELELARGTETKESFIISWANAIVNVFKKLTFK